MSQPLSFRSESSAESWEVVSYKKKPESSPLLRKEASPWKPKPADQLRQVTQVFARATLEEKKEAPAPQGDSSPVRERARPFQIVPNVHQDDIHGCLRLPDQTFISGSKDGSLKKWDLNGKWICNVYLPPKINYYSWITALAPLGRDYWLSGTRDGYVDYWNVEGFLEKNLQTPPRNLPNDHKCKERNVQRINCLADLTHFTPDTYTFLAGRPTRFSLHSLKDQGLKRHCETSKNDWVYCIHPLSANSFLVVTGTNLDIWKSAHLSHWEKDPLITEPYQKPTDPNEVRPFISAVTPLDGNSFGLAVFDGSVRVYDLARKILLSKSVEHKKRVWTVENLRPHMVASCGDDGYIKLWDLRQMKHSTATLQDNLKEKARVSVLLSINEETLMSGSCPDEVRISKEKAQFSFWDLRKI